MKNLILFITLSLFMQDAMAFQHKRKKVKRATNKVIRIPEKKHPVLIPMLRLCDAPSPQPAWFLDVSTNIVFPANFQRPANYRVITTIDSSLFSFLKGIPTVDSKVKMMLPLFIDQTIECKEFIVSRTQTMDPALQAKYPQLMSFKAFAANNSLNAARIDCDENTIKMMVTYDKKVYFLTSMKQHGKLYFLSYAKDDPNFVKDKFER